MSPSFIEKNTAEPTRRLRQPSQSSSQKHSSQSPSTKSKPGKDEKPKPTKETASKSTKEVILDKKSSNKRHISAKTDSSPNKQSKSKEIDNAAPTKDSKSKKSTKQSSEQELNHVLQGTPIKNRLVEKTNANGTASNAEVKPKPETIVKMSTSVATAFSPIKTRSRANKTAITADAQLKAKSKLKLPQFDGANDIPKETKKTRAKPRAKQKDISSDDDFDPVPVKKIRAKITPQKIENKNLSRAKQIDRRVLSTDEEFEEEPNTNRMNFWVEAYAEKEKKWIVIDPVKKKVDSIDHVRVSLDFIN